MNLSFTVHKKYGSFSLAADVAVTGDRLGIFGPSGSGKSTLVAMLAGLSAPDCGEIILNGDLLFSSAGSIDVPPGKRRVALVFQQHELFPHLNVRSNLLYGHKRCPAEERRIDFATLTEVLQIDHLLDRGVGNLSGGEKQRIAIGRAVLSNPRLLLMDEPLSALDDTLRFQIIRYLKSVCETFRVPYLFISHSLIEMRLMADTVLVFENGVMTGQTSSEQLARDRMGQSPVGYINILGLTAPRQVDGMTAFSWQGNRLLVSSEAPRNDARYELSSKDIILFKRHPEATSARNLLKCSVRSLFTSGRKTGVELDCNGAVLVAEVVREAVTELEITPGSTVFAAIKASAFRAIPG